MSLERLKFIDGYDKYLVSTWGKVYRVDFVEQVLNEDIDFCTRKLHELATETTSKGYLRVALFKNGKRKWHKVHRLVAKAFIPNPYNKPQINHVDGNKENNSITNLEWVTDEENKLHQRKLYEYMKGETHHDI